MKHLILALALTAPSALFAAGSVSPTPPKATETTTECAEGMLFVAAVKNGKGACMAIEDIKEKGLMTEEELMEAVRELSYNGRLNDAQNILPSLDQSDDLVLTYWGFTSRKLGDVDTAMAYYTTALTQNPDNLLARSYMGQAYVEMGDIAAAKHQLRAIKARGGTQTWPSIALSNSIRTGQGYAY